MGLSGMCLQLVVMKMLLLTVAKAALATTQLLEAKPGCPTKGAFGSLDVEVERIRERVHDKLMNKLAATRHKAEEKRAEAEAKRNRQAAKTEQQAEYIRRTGHIPSSFSCWSWCSW